MQEFDNLTGKILISMPSAHSNIAEDKTLIYVMHHSPHGVIGFVLNREVYTLPAEDIFQEHHENKTSSRKTIDVHVGGPLDIRHGFFLHSDDYTKDILIHNKASKLCISSNLDIIDNIMQDEGPLKIMLVVGYTEWKGGQLEEEIQDNFWAVADPNHDLIFNTDQDASWSYALDVAGIAKEHLVNNGSRIFS